MIKAYQLSKILKAGESAKDDFNYYFPKSQFIEVGIDEGYYYFKVASDGHDKGETEELCRQFVPKTRWETLKVSGGNGYYIGEFRIAA